MFFSLQYWLLKIDDWFSGAMPAVGLDGIRRARLILKKYKAVGLLVGGTAKDIWSGRIQEENQNYRKMRDVDVLVFDYECERHPGEWEGGIDWFVRHSPTQLHNNGKMDIDFCLKLVDGISYTPDLYLCHWSILQAIDEYLDKELEKIYGGFYIDTSEKLSCPLPIIEPEHLMLTLALGGPVKNHCKPLGR